MSQLSAQLAGRSTSLGRALANAIRRDRGNSLVLGLSILWGGLKLIRGLAARRREVVFKAKLAPGEGVQIRNLAVGVTSSRTVNGEN